MKIIDLHCDTITVLASEHKDLRQNDLNLDLLRMKKQEIMLQDFAVFVRLTEYKTLNEAWEYTLAMCKFFKEQMAANKDLISQVFSYKDIEENQAKDKISALLSLEEGGVLEENIERLVTLYKEGVRLITISWNFENTLGYPNSMTEPTLEKHLKPFGREVVKTMDELHMLVDVSHAGDGSFWDIADIVKGPFVASHSDARTLTDHSRNLTDPMIKTLAQHGGVTGINFFSKFLGADGTGSIEQMVAHIKHIRKVGGIDVIALGSDFDGFGGASGVRTCEDFPKLFAALTKAGFTDEELEKISHKNALRVMRDVLK